MPDPPGLYGYLLPNGNLFYGGKLRDHEWDRFLSWKRFIAPKAELPDQSNPNMAPMPNAPRNRTSSSMFVETNSFEPGMLSVT